MKKIKNIIKFIMKKVGKLMPKSLIITWWKIKGMPIPPPHSVKQGVIKKYKEVSNINIFVETGTYKGEMIHALRNEFKKIYSVELSYDFWKSAVEKFHKYNHIEITHGDSGKKMNDVLTKINESTIFWLDGHYSSGITAKGEKDTPIHEELEVILKSEYDNIILIDDARCFTGENDYPKIQELKDFIYSLKPDYNFEVKNDIIRIIPKKYYINSSL